MHAYIYKIVPGAGAENNTVMKNPWPFWKFYEMQKQSHVEVDEVHQRLGSLTAPHVSMSISFCGARMFHFYTGEVGWGGMSTFIYTSCTPDLLKMTR